MKWNRLGSLLIISCSMLLVSCSPKVKVKRLPIGEEGSTDSINRALLVISDGPMYDFGTQLVNTSTDRVLSIVNSGTVTATGMMNGLSLSAPFSFKGGSYPGTSGSCGETLATSSSCIIVITYTPLTEATHSDTISINYNDGVSTQVSSREVTGVGISSLVATLSISDGPTYNYGTRVLNTVTDKIFTISNTGTGPATVLSGTGLAAPYAFKGGSYPGTAGTCGATLAAAGSCTIVVTYTPTLVATNNDTISVSYNDGSNTQNALRAITGVGVASMGISRTIGWDENPAHEILVGYKLYFGSADGVYDGACVHGTETSPVIVTIASLADPANPSYTIDDFDDGSSCYFAITAYNAEIESEKSAAMAFIP